MKIRSNCARTAAFISLLVILSTGVGVLGIHAQDQAEVEMLSARPVSKRMLVRFRKQSSQSRNRNLITARGGRLAGQIPELGLNVVELSTEANSSVFTQSLSSDPDVEFIEPDRVVTLAGYTPNDPLYRNEWHLTKIQGPTAWSLCVGSSSVTIAILDTGVDSTHPDLAAKIVPGWNCYDNNSDTSDVHGHGTNVAGTAAAISDNGIGVASVAWNCMIMPVRVGSASGQSSLSIIANGLVWAADNGARVANVSFSGTQSSTVSLAAQYFQSKGGVVTVAAGNAGSFDASADDPYVLTVSATDTRDRLASFSNTGNNVDVSAPGDVIFTTERGGNYQVWSGTSFSAPIVAGVAALVMSVNPDLGPDEVQDLLKHTAKDLGSTGWDSGFGWGRINAAAAINGAIASGPVDTTPPTVTIYSPTDGMTLSRSTSIYVSASDNTAVTKVELYVDGVLTASSTTAPFTTAWNPRKASTGAHTLQCKAYDAAGNTGSSAPVTVYK